MRRNEANTKLRERIDKSGLYLWQLASKMGISAGTITLWLREELAETDERRIKIETVLDQLERGG